MKKRYAIAGTGVRSLCFAKALLKDFTDCAELVALFDKNPLRIRGFNELLDSNIPGFTDFDEMVSSVKPTHLIIGTPDNTHDEFIKLAFENNMDVITEKPMTTTAEKVRRIFKLEKKYGRKTTVTFNYRYVPYVAKIKEIIKNGSFGRPLSVSLDWHLDKLHGAEYFRRWHANMEKSGGLLVHKATHHFDLVNWLIDDEPLEVSAFGTLMLYGKNGSFRSERCSSCPHVGGKCQFEMEVHKAEGDKIIFDKLYWDAEKDDGYIRDKCIFREEIDIYDTMNALVKYKKGTQMSYSLTAHAPYAGYELNIMFENGRIEAAERHASMFMTSDENTNIIKLCRGTNRQNQTLEKISVDVDKSDHGGGDMRMYRQLFRGDLPDHLHQAADSRAGAMSCLVGIAANVSIREKKVISIDSLLS